MFNGFDTRFEAVIQPLATESVARNAPAFFVRFVHNRFHFFQRESRRNHHFPTRSKAEIVSRVKLDEVGAVGNLIAHRLTRSPGGVDDCECARNRHLRRVAPHDKAACRLNTSGCNLHAWTLYYTAIDGIAQIHIAVHGAQCLQITEGREPDHQVLLRIGQSGESPVLIGVAQNLHFQIRAIAEHVCVSVDQTRKNGGVAQIDYLGVGWNFDLVGGSDLDDLLAVDQYHLVDS